MTEPSTDRPAPSRIDGGVLFVLAAFAIGAIGFIVFFAVGVFQAGSAFQQMADMETHTYAPPMFATAAEATKACGIKLPPEAINIWIESRSEWLEGGEYVRFEAPVSVCLTHAAEVVEGKPLLPVRSDRLVIKAGMSMAVTEDDADGSGPPPLIVGRQPGWFDLKAAKNVVASELPRSGTDDHSGPPTVWVDQSRGVYYYHSGTL